MDGTVAAALIATAISIGPALLAGCFGGLVAMRSRTGAAGDRDICVSMLLGIACLLMLLIVVAAARIALAGLAYDGLLRAALLLTAAFAVVGMALGLVRGLRSGGAIKTPSL